ncbi:hypothetical protein KYB31_01585 [Clostridium felsineum]|uniref:hypothetical protein n=1 Tax=Clostridium felsineum TaxID=36839 RepID=UPI00098C2E7E|nr:hypothetical protein [Clostridium felsineum]MCR3757684.1 hypothetical protein [Clostridium felsineum]URZ01071.1 hypothetical protein CLAUR_010590 [Clostridium felsineum]
MKYDIPFLQKSNLKLKSKITYIVLTIFMLAMAAVFFTLIMQSSFIFGFLFGVFMATIGLFMGYLFIYAGLLKKFYIKMTDQYLEVSMPFKTRKAYWNEIYSVEIYRINNNTAVSILLKKDIGKARKRTVFNNFNQLYGINPYSFQISLSFFEDIDLKKFITTIEIKRKENFDPNIIEENIIEDNDYKENKNNILKAVIVSIMVTLVLGVIYGFLICNSKKNYIAIPMFGSAVIIAVFNKYYLEKAFSLIVRFVVGIVCLMQIPIAIISACLFEGGADFSISYVIYIIRAYYEYVIYDTMKAFGFIFAAVVCFGIGFFAGRISISKK